MALTDEINNLVAELGLEYLGEFKDESGKQLLRFRIVDRAKTGQEEIRAIADSLWQVLLTAPRPEVIELAQAAQGVILE